MAIEKNKSQETGLSAAAAGMSRYETVSSEEVVQSVIEDLESMFAVRVKEIREGNLMLYWETGETLRAAERDYKVNITDLIDRVGRDNRMSGRQMGKTNLQIAVRTFDTWPVFEKIYNTSHGENISISKIKKLLTVPRPKKEPTIDEIARRIYNNMGEVRTLLLIKALQKLIDAE